MTKTSNKIVFFGNERLSSGFEPNGAPTLQALVNAGYSVVAVVANHHEPQSRKARSLGIKDVAQANNIPLLLPQNLKDIQNQLESLKPQLGVLVAYGRMVPQAIINLFPRGIVNIHPSLLPEYRGSTPIEQAILDGKNHTGVSLMQLVKAMDAGPLFGQAHIDLDGTESKVELTQTLLSLGGQMLLEKLPPILEGSLLPTQQKGEPTYCGLINKADSQLDIKKPAYRLERQVRAYLGWPKSRTTLFGQEVIVTKSRVVVTKTNGLILACAEETFLEITELIAPSGRRMSGVDFKRGYQKKS